MSPRPRNNRIVFDPPKFKGFRPFGYYSGSGEAVFLQFEEYTAIRLCDYEFMTQLEAAGVMGISRPTFTRLYESARRKIALALTEARSIEIEKGHAYFDHDWFQCKSCKVFFNVPDPEFPANSCPVCHSKEIETVHEITREK